MKRPSLRIPVCITIYAVCCAAPWAQPREIPLSGLQEGVFEKADYIVAQSVIVPKGSIMTLPAGAVVRFAPYAGIIVEGTLLCRGAIDAPVVFTSINDRPSSEGGGRPAAMDWNGVEIRDSATADMSFCRVAYSTFGVQAEKSAKLRLANVVFASNGRANVSVDGRTVPAEDGKPFSYASGLTAAEQAVRQSAAPSGKDNASRKQGRPTVALRIAFGGCAIAAAGVSAAMFVMSERYWDTYDAEMSDKSTGYGDKAEAYSAAGIGAAIAAGAACIGFGITFLF